MSLKRRGALTANRAAIFGRLVRPAMKEPTLSHRARSACRGLSGNPLISCAFSSGAAAVTTFYTYPERTPNSAAHARRHGDRSRTGEAPRQAAEVGRNGYAECADREVGGRGRRVYFVDTGGREIARRTINERRPPCRHYVRG